MSITVQTNYFSEFNTTICYLYPSAARLAHCKVIKSQIEPEGRSRGALRKTSRASCSGLAAHPVAKETTDLGLQLALKAAGITSLSSIILIELQKGDASLGEPEKKEAIWETSARKCRTKLSHHEKGGGALAFYIRWTSLDVYVLLC